jgi:hypothetical protein
MADILIDNQVAPTTPAAGKSVLWIDSTTKKLVMTDDAGLRHGNPLSEKQSTASQGAGFAADTYVTDSGILIPGYGMEAGQVYRWFISVSKTAAGTAAAVFTFRIGSAQTTSDTARLAVTAALAQTAAASSGLLIGSIVVRNVGAAGVIAGGVGVAASAGLGSGADGVGAAFDNSALAGQFIGLSINGGASAAWTITSVSAELVA